MTNLIELKRAKEALEVKINAMEMQQKVNSEFAETIDKLVTFEPNKTMSKNDIVKHFQTGLDIVLEKLSMLEVLELTRPEPKVATETKKSILRKSHAIGFVHHRNEYIAYLLHTSGLNDDTIAKIFSDKRNMDIKSGVQSLGSQVLTTSKDIKKRREWMLANNKLETWSKDHDTCQKVVDSLILTYHN